VIVLHTDFGLRTNELISLQVGTSGPWVKVMKRSTLGVKDQGRTRPVVELEAWRMHHS